MKNFRQMWEHVVSNLEGWAYVTQGEKGGK